MNKHFHIAPLLVIINFLLLFPDGSYVSHASDQVTQSQSFSEQTLIKTQDISDSIMSPYCPGRTLSACPSEKARNLRNEINVFFDRGYSREAVIRHLSAKYGSAIKGEPESDGIWILAWITPILLIVLACLVIRLWIKKNATGNLRVDKSGSKTITKELEDELKNRLNM